MNVDSFPNHLLKRAEYLNHFLGKMKPCTTDSIFYMLSFCRRQMTLHTPCLSTFRLIDYLGRFSIHTYAYALTEYYTTYVYLIYYVYQCRLTDLKLPSLRTHAKTNSLPFLLRLHENSSHSSPAE